MTANQKDVHDALPSGNTLKHFGHNDHFRERGVAVVEAFDSLSKLICLHFR